jgi:hypothetical protein
MLQKFRGEVFPIAGDNAMEHLASWTEWATPELFALYARHYDELTRSKDWDKAKQGRMTVSKEMNLAQSKQ